MTRRDVTGQTTRDRKRAKRECRRFVEHLQWLARHGYRDMTLEETRTLLRPVQFAPDEDGGF